MTKDTEKTTSPDVAKKSPAPSTTWLQGQILIAMPDMEDSRFSRSLVYLCSHDEEGAMGLIINKTYPSLGFLDITEQLNDKNRHSLPEKTVCYGGPVDPGRGFVLHSPDFRHKNHTQPLNDKLSLTATIDIIEAIANHKGPDKSLVTLGYASWTAGQLEKELLDNGWLHCPATTELLFHEDIDNKYEMALESIGISQDFLITEPGHA